MPVAGLVKFVAIVADAEAAEHSLVAAAVESVVSAAAAVGPAAEVSAGVAVFALAVTFLFSFRYSQQAAVTFA